MVTVCPSQFATRRTLFHVLVGCGLLMLKVSRLKLPVIWLLVSYPPNCMFSCLQILEAFLWFVLITLLNVTLIILTLSVSRLLNLLLRLVAFLLFLNPQCLASISRWITASSSWKRFCLFVCRALSSSAFHDETGRLNVDGMNIISNDGSNKLNRSRKARVSYKVQRTINASLNAATSTRAVSSNPNFVRSEERRVGKERRCRR